MTPMSARIFILAFLLLCGAGGASLLVSDAVAYHSETADELTGIRKAASEGDLRLVKRYIDGGTHPDERGGKRDTALMWAAYRGHFSIVQYLLSVGANVNAKDNPPDWMPLHNAAVGGNEKIIVALIKAGAHVNSQSEIGETPLHLAYKNKNNVAFDALMEHGADINKKNRKGESVRGWIELREVADLVASELAKAEQLLKRKDFSNASVALTGAALERFLRDWVEIAGLRVPEDKKGIYGYARALLDKEIIEKKTYNNLLSWGRLRNHAAHGEWELIRHKASGAMLQCTRELIQKHGYRSEAHRLGTRFCKLPY